MGPEEEAEESCRIQIAEDHKSMFQQSAARNWLRDRAATEQQLEGEPEEDEQSAASGRVLWVWRPSCWKCQS